MVLNVKALNPNPARTIPLAVALVLSEKDLATALTAAVRPAAPPHPERNIEKHRKTMPLVEGSADGLGRMGIYPKKKARTREYPVKTRVPPMKSGLKGQNDHDLKWSQAYMRAPRVSVIFPHKGPMRYMPKFPAVPTRFT